MQVLKAPLMKRKGKYNLSRMKAEKLEEILQTREGESYAVWRTRTTAARGELTKRGIKTVIRYKTIIFQKQAKKKRRANVFLPVAKNRWLKYFYPLFQFTILKHQLRHEAFHLAMYLFQHPPLTKQQIWQVAKVMNLPPRSIFTAMHDEGYFARFTHSQFGKDNTHMFVLSQELKNIIDVFYKELTKYAEFEDDNFHLSPETPEHPEITSWLVSMRKKSQDMVMGRLPYEPVLYRIEEAPVEEKKRGRPPVKK